MKGSFYLLISDTKLIFPIAFAFPPPTFDSVPFGGSEIVDQQPRVNLQHQRGIAGRSLHVITVGQFIADVHAASSNYY